MSRIFWRFVAPQIVAASRRVGWHCTDAATAAVKIGQNTDHVVRTIRTDSSKYNLKNHAFLRACRKIGSDGPGSRKKEKAVASILGPKIITDQILRGYGNLRLPIELFSWFGISVDFEENSATYPEAMKAVLSEPKWQVIQHQWSLQHWDRSRTVKWRPHSNFCDPEWLVADLLGHLTDTLKIDAWQDRVKKRIDHPTTFADPYDRQMDCVLDCHLRIGNEDEVCFEFGGRPYRWINGSLESDAIISVALKKNEDGLSVEEELNRLLTLLGWEHRIAISRKAGSSVIGAKRPLPWMAGVRSGMGLLVEPQWLFRENPSQISPRKWLAMSLYREALNSRSVFYEFLNYWKAIEIVFPNVANRRAWIDSNVTKLHLERERVAEIQKTQASVADYLYTDSRCAVAHVDHRPFVDPDKAEDYHRLSRDARLVKGLARIAIESMQ